MKEGWVCPKCGRVLAPFIAECSCHKIQNEKHAQGECESKRLSELFLEILDTSAGGRK